MFYIYIYREYTKAECTLLLDVWLCLKNVFPFDPLVDHWQNIPHFQTGPCGKTVGSITCIYNYIYIINIYSHHVVGVYIPVFRHIPTMIRYKDSHIWWRHLMLNPLLLAARAGHWPLGVYISFRRLQSLLWQSGERDEYCSIQIFLLPTFLGLPKSDFLLWDC